MKLKDKVTVVTGGNSGIGFGIAASFSKEGANGAITGRNQQTIDKSVEQWGTNFIGLKGDVTNLDDLELIFKETFNKFGKIDALVVNAGGVVDGNALNKWQLAFVIAGCRLLLRLFLDSFGKSFLKCSKFLPTTCG